jgi:uncharacterized coiled-coil protein SlyX
MVEPAAWIAGLAAAVANNRAEVRELRRQLELLRTRIDRLEGVVPGARPGSAARPSRDETS